MKKILFGLFLSSVAHGATVGSLTLRGVVPAVTSITVNPAVGYNSLDLTTTQNNLAVADVVETSNDSNGYVVTVASTNAGKLVNGSNTFTYTAKYNNTAFTLSTTAVIVTNQGAQTTVVNATKPLTISYTGVPSTTLMSGNYVDTLTFTITAN